MTTKNEIIADLRAHAEAETRQAERYGNNNSGTGVCMSRASHAREMVKVIEKGEVLAVTGYKKVILLIGLDCLPIDKLSAFARGWMGSKANANGALGTLDGVSATISLSRAGSAWVIRFGARGESLVVLHGMEWNSLPCQNTTNGAGRGHWVALCNRSLAKERLAQVVRGEKKISSEKHSMLEDVIKRSI